MKKIMCYVLVLCMLFGMSITVSADSLEEMQLAEMLRNYLTANASAKYEEEGKSNSDLIADTISSLSEKQSAVLAQKASTISSRTKGENLVPIEIDREIGNYLTEKAAYFKYIREDGNLEVTNLSTTYGKPEIAIVGDTANVKIFETVSMRYTCLDEDSAESTEYDIDLIKIDGTWKIAELRSDDIFDKTHEKDFRCEEGIAQREAARAQPEAIVQKVKAPDIEELQALAAANNAKVYSYNRTNAVNYSKQYTTSTGVNTRSYYNPNFEEKVGYDCMNFASQCMFAGFGGSDEPNIRAYDPPMDRVGSNDYEKWYYQNQTWIGTLTFQNYARKSVQTSGSQDNLYVNLYSVTPDQAGLMYDYMNRLPGAIVFVDDGKDDGENQGHAMVISKVTGPKDSQIFVSAHTTDVKLKPLAFCNSGTWYNVVVPESYYCYSGQPQVRVTCNWKDNVPAGTTVTFSGNAERRSGGTCYRMAIEVIPPDKSASSWSNGVMSTNSISHAFTLNQKGLYTIKIYAKETYNTSGNVSSTMTLRTY